MKFCVACDETAKAAKEKKNISIEDVQNTASIVDPDALIQLSDAGYNFRALKSIEKIIGDGAPVPL